jgi:methylmalonyl-CoA mutase N-terminal domain/subunit
VGVNQFQMEEAPLQDIFRIQAGSEANQKEKLSRVKQERDDRQVQQALTVLRETAEGTGNLVPPILAAVRAYATVGEISDTLRAVFGEYREL